MAAHDELIAAYAAKRPRSGAWHERARDALAGGVGHDLRHSEPVPLYIQRGRGSRKWDADGNEYIDFLMGNGALLLGHADEEIVQAVCEAAGEGTHFGNDHPLQIEWAELIQQLIPSADRVRFTNSGTESTHLAIRLARAWTGRTKLLRFEGHFHGWHDGVVHGYQTPFEADGSLGVPSHVRDQTVMLPDTDLAPIETALQNGDIAAAIVEPSGGSWGRAPVSREFLSGLRELTTRFDVPLIFDEIVTGFRYSPGGAQGLFDVLPDLTCLAKIVAGGMPGGVVAGREDIMRLFDITGDGEHDRFGRVSHQGTFNAAPLSAAAGVVALQRVRTEVPTRTADERAEQLRSAWDAVLEHEGIAGYVYGQSSVFHVYFETNAERLRDASCRSDLHTLDAERLKGMPGRLNEQYQRLLRFHGVDIMSGTGGVLSAVHTSDDIDQATSAFKKTVVALRDENVIHSL